MFRRARPDLPSGTSAHQRAVQRERVDAPGNLIYCLKLFEMMGFPRYTRFGVALFGGAIIVAFLIPTAGALHTWVVVGSVYALTAILVGMWYTWGRIPRFRATVGISSAIVVVLIPLTTRLLVEWGTSTPTLVEHVAVVVPLHLQRAVPVAFMLPLGAAPTRRSRLYTVGIILLPSMYELVNWFVFNPQQFDPFYTTPLKLVVATVFWVLFFGAFGSLLALLGRHLLRVSVTE